MNSDIKHWKQVMPGMLRLPGPAQKSTMPIRGNYVCGFGTPHDYGVDFYGVDDCVINTVHWTISPSNAATSSNVLFVEPDASVLQVVWDASFDWQQTVTISAEVTYKDDPLGGNCIRFSETRSLEVVIPPPVSVTNGSVTGPSTITTGDQVTFTFNADQIENLHFAAWTIDDQRVSGNLSEYSTSFAFEDNGSHTIEFTPKNQCAQNTSSYSFDFQVNLSPPADEPCDEDLFSTDEIVLPRPPAENGIIRAGCDLTFTSRESIVIGPGMVIEAGANVEFVVNPGALDAGRCSDVSKITYDLPDVACPEVQQFLAGRMASTSNDNVTSWYSYDYQGRLEWMIQDIIGLGTKKVAYEYDLIGKLISVKYQEGASDAFDHYYEYDPDQRLSKVYSSTDGGINKVLQASYEYYLHGPLKRVELASVDHNNVTFLNYGYNSIGQMTSQTETDGPSMYVSYNAYGLVTGVYADAAYSQPVVLFDYDDKGFRLAKHVYNESSQEIMATWYVRDAGGNLLAVYTEDIENNQPLAQTEVPVYASGRLGMYKPEQQLYMYEVTDHLGNVRAVVIDNPFTLEFLATMEQENRAEETQLFYNVEESSHMDDIYNHTPDETGTDYKYMAWLNPAEPGGKTVGPAFSIPLNPGDKVNMEVYAQYTGSTSGNTTLTEFLATALATAYGYTGGPETQHIFDLFNEALLSVATPLNPNSDVPTAYIQYFFFDQDFNLDRHGHQFISDNALNTWEKLDLHDLEFVADKPGSLFVFVINESMAGIDVYFDDLKITLTESPVVVGNDYYPFGMPIADRSYERHDYRFDHQGQFSEKDDETGWNSFQLRMYDARTGRWISPDPYGQYNSPYVGMGNAPVSGVDPDGGLFNLGPLGSSVAGFGIGFALGSGFGLIYDKDNWWKYGLATGGIGLGVGLATADYGRLIGNTELRSTLGNNARRIRNNHWIYRTSGRYWPPNIDLLKVLTGATLNLLSELESIPEERDIPPPPQPRKKVYYEDKRLDHGIITAGNKVSETMRVFENTISIKIKQAVEFSYKNKQFDHVEVEIVKSKLDVNAYINYIENRRWSKQIKLEGDWYKIKPGVHPAPVIKFYYYE